MDWLRAYIRYVFTPEDSQSFAAPGPDNLDPWSGPWAGRLKACFWMAVAIGLAVALAQLH